MTQPFSDTSLPAWVYTALRSVPLAWASTFFAVLGILTWHIISNFDGEYWYAVQLELVSLAFASLAACVVVLVYVASVVACMSLANFYRRFRTWRFERTKFSKVSNNN